MTTARGLNLLKWLGKRVIERVGRPDALSRPLKVIALRLLCSSLMRCMDPCVSEAANMLKGVFFSHVFPSSLPDLIGSLNLHGLLTPPSTRKVQPAVRGVGCSE